MNIAQTIPVAAASGNIGAGWLIGMVVCMLFMGVMMFGMTGRGRAKSSWPGWWSGGRAGSRSETPTEVLDRRFAEGEISAEDYRERREVLANGAPRGRGAVGDDERDVVSKATGDEGR